ncbi:MAG: carboxypeptidase-like regulatory domain-containing protein, partial [bacterium]|nr:carboxypeptidase-like regulatory domain-containing protein [Candidatus Kapabacteria bacterium]
MHTLRLVALLLYLSTAALAQNVLVTGTVLDASTRDPVAGATVRLLDRSRGTYTARTGGFRLPLPAGSYRVVVSSIGYVSDTVSITTGGLPVTVRLQPSAIDIGGISVTAEFTADDVVRSAILRKEENLARLKTFNGLLYSKFSFDLAGDAFGQIKDEDRAIIMETFSRYYYDREETPPIHIDVINRRQTANIPSEGNLFALGNFVSFYDDELPLLNARVMTPLADGAFSRYRFEFAGRTTLGDQTVFVIKVIPTTRVLPAFSGTMKIVKGTYNLVEVDLKPTEATAIAFVRDLHFLQRFERLTGDVWYPTFMEITGAATVEIVKGFAQIDATVKATSIVSEAIVNEQLPDSVFGPRTGSPFERGDDQIISAAPDADSARPEFWENNALSELS